MPSTVHDDELLRYADRLKGQTVVITGECFCTLYIVKHLSLHIRRGEGNREVCCAGDGPQRVCHAKHVWQSPTRSRTNMMFKEQILSLETSTLLVPRKPYRKYGVWDGI